MKRRRLTKEAKELFMDLGFVLYLGVITFCAVYVFISQI